MYVQQRIQRPFQGNLRQQHFPKWQAMLQWPFLQTFWVHLLTYLTTVSRSLLLLVENLLSLPPPPTLPKTPVIARTIVEIVIERAVSIENMAIPCSENKVRILSANDAFWSRTYSRVFLILATCVWRYFQFLDSISSLAFFSVFRSPNLSLCNCFCPSI